MRKLQEFASLTPLMRQFIAFAIVAVGARDNEIFRAIRPAARKRDYMVNVKLVAHWFAAPVAFALLRFVLAEFIGGSMRTGRSPLSGAIVPCVSTRFISVSYSPFSALLTVVFAVLSFLLTTSGKLIFMGAIIVITPSLSMIFAFFPITALGFFGMVLPIFAITLRSKFWLLNSILAREIATTLTIAIMIGKIPIMQILRSAFSTCVGQPIFSAGITGEIFSSSREYVTALAAALHGDIHSVSLSLRPSMLLAGGRTYHRSVANLANIHIIPQGAAND